MPIPRKLTLFFALSAVSQARVLYVDAALARDCAGDYNVTSRSCSGSEGQAFATIPPALVVMRPGDTIQIRGGVYTDPVIVNRSGTASAHLRIKGYPGESVVIDVGSTAGAVNGIDATSQRYVDFAGLIVRNAPTYGFKASSSDHVTLTNAEIAFSRHGGVVFENATNAVIAQCNVHHNNQLGLTSMHEAVSLQNVDRFQISNCQVHDNLKEGIVAKYGASQGTISGNLSYRNHGPNIYLDGAYSISVFDNICHDTGSADKAGIGIAVESTYNTVKATSHDLSIYNNVIYGNGAGISFWFEAGALSWARLYNIRIEYNTIADNNQNNWGGIYIINGGRSNYRSGNIIRNNVFWNNTSRAGAASIRDDAGVVQTFGIDHNLFQSGEPSAAMGVAAVSSRTNPFVSESTFDYHLTSSSPARNMGAPDPDILQDFDGRPRPATMTDVGAFQFYQ